MLSCQRLAILVVAISTTLNAQSAPTAPPPAYTIRNFKTESGIVLPEARIVYGTYGRLNAAHNNAVLVPSHYMATSRGYEWLIGPGRALDTSQVFVVATELFGNGRSSSPSNTPEPYHGPRFPAMTIRDNVEAVHELLTKQFGITHLKAIIGFSMGAQQAFQWAVSYPTVADRYVATSGTARTWPHGQVRLEGQIAAITADPAFNEGNYTTPPARGLSAFGMVWAGWLYSQDWWRRELWRTPARPDATYEQIVDRFRKNFIPGADANDLILQMRTWERHDVAGTLGMNGDLPRALGSISAPFLYMPSETDLYFPITDARTEASMMKTVRFVPIHSWWGHTAGAASNPADAQFLNATIGGFLRGDETPADDREAAIAAAQSVLTAISTRDTALAHRILMPGAQLVASPDSLGAAATVRVQSDTTFLRLIGSASSRFLERMWDPSVDVMGTVALVHAPYDFHIDGKFSHCGIDTFTLAKTPQGWRVSHLAYTVQRSGCEPSPLGPVR